jgi:hypothetical protein
MGEARTMGALLLGERIPGITAAEWGLVWTCVVDEELSSTSEQIARKLASGPTAAYDLIKRMVRRQSAGGLRIAWMPAEIIMIDLDDNRLGLARQFGATQTINSSDSKAAEKVKAPTCRRGVGTAAIEAVGVPPTLLLCQELLTPSGGIANIGAHGQKVDLHLETLWSQNISITTRLVPMQTRRKQGTKSDATMASQTSRKHPRAFARP